MFEGIGIQLSADTAGFISGMRNAGRELENFGSTSSSVKQALGQLTGALSATISVAAFVKVGDAVTQVRNQLNLATGSVEKATAAYDGLFEIAQRSRVNFVELAGTFSQISRAGDALGLTQAQLLKVTETIGNAVTVSGSSATASAAALTQLSQALGSGVLRGDELNSIMEQTPRLAKAIADGLGVTTSKLREMGKEGQLTAENVIGAIQSQSTVLANEVSKSAITVGQAFTIFQNSATGLVAEIDRTSGVTLTLANTVKQASDSLTSIAGAFKQAETEGAGFASFGRAISTVFETVAVLGANVSYVLKGIGTELGGLAAQSVAIATGNLKQAQTIRAEMLADAEKSRKDIDALSERILSGKSGARTETVGSQFADDEAQRLALRKAQREASYKAALTTYATDSEKLAAEIAKQKAALGDLYTPELEARIRKHFIKPVKDASDDYGRLGATIARELDLANEQLLAGSRLTESDKFRIKTLSQIDESLRKGNITKTQALKLEEQMTVAQQKREEVEKAAAQRRANIAQYQDQIAFQSELDAAYVADSKSREQARLTVDAYEKSIRDSNDMLALEASLMGQSATVREATLEQYRIELELKKQIDAIDRSAGLDEAQREELRARARVAAASASAQASTRATISEWKKTSEQIEQTLTDAIMRGFENGKGFAENLRDTVVNMFKTMVLRPIVSAIVLPVSSTLASVLPGAAAAGQGGALGTVNTAVQTKSLYDTVTGAFTSLGSSITTAASKMGLWLVENTSGMLQKAGIKLYNGAGSLGTVGAYAGGALAGYGLGTAISGGRSVFGDGNQDIATVGGTAIGAIFGGPMGAAIGGAIGGAINRAFGQGAKTVDATGIQGTFSGSMFSGQSFQEWSRSSGWFNSGSSGTDYSALDAGYSSKLGKVYGALTSSTAQLADSLGLPTSQILGYVKSIRIDSSQLTESGLQAVFEGIADELARTVVTSGYIKEGERASVALSRLSTSLATVNGAFNTLNKTALSAGLSTADAASQLLDLFGGADAFNTATLSYYQNYYTEAERNAKTTENLVKSFANLGVAMPDSTATFRALVDAQDITTESGRTTYTALMGLQEAFAAVTKAAEDSAKSLIKTANYATYADYAAAMAAAGGTAAARFDGGDLSGGSLLALSPALMTATASSSTPAAAQMDAATAAEVQALREENRAQSRALASIMERFAQIIETWDAIGMPAVQPD